MALFYKFVVFKENEFIREMLKSKHAFQMKKVVTYNQEMNSDKGLIMVRTDLKNPMTINFINKTGVNMIGYEKN